MASGRHSKTKPVHTHHAKHTHKHAKPARQSTETIETAKKLLAEGQYDDARRIALKHADTNVLDTLDTVAEILAYTGDVDAALQAYNRALAIDGKTADAAYRMLSILELTGDTQILMPAIAILRKHSAAREHRDALVTALALAADACLVGSEKPDLLQASAFVEEATGLSPKAFEACVAKCATMLCANAMEDLGPLARSTFQLLVDAGHIALGDADEGDGSQTFVAQPGSDLPMPGFLLSLSRVLTSLECLDEAEAVCELLLSLNPRDPVFLHEMAWVHNLGEDYEAALTLLRQARDIYLEEDAPEDVIDDIEGKIVQLEATSNQAV